MMKRSKRPRSLVYPSKISVNFADARRFRNRPKLNLPLALLVVVVTVAVIKFAVFDPAARLEHQRAQLALAERQLELALTTTQDYAQVSERYRRIFFQGLREDELAAVDRISALELLETELLTKAQVDSFSVVGNVASVQLSYITLRETSALMNTLEAHPIVTGVDVFTAGSQEEAADGTPLVQPQDALQATVTMTISLAPPAEEGGDAS